VTQLEVVFAATIERIDAIASELKRLRTKGFPRPIATRLLESLGSLLPAMAKDVERAYQKATGRNASWVELSKEVRGLTSPLTVIHALLHFLDKTDSSRVPFELLDAFQALSLELTGSEVDFILKPERSYNYSTGDLQSYVPGLGLALKKHPALPAARIVCFPSAEAASTLLHTLLFHEIAHTVYEQKASAVGIEEIVQSGIRRALPGDGSTPANVQFDADALLADWLEEIFCDCFAYRLVGPAYASAYFWYSEPFAAASSGDKQHPEPALRAQFLRDYVEHLKTTDPEAKAVCDLFGDHHIPSTAAGIGLSGGPEKELARAAILDTEVRKALFSAVDAAGP
jgi:hypothetical protein